MHIKFILLNICIFVSYVLIWIGLTADFKDWNYLIAAIITFIFSYKLKLLPKSNIFKINSFYYCAYLLKEIILSAWAVSKIAWRKKIIIDACLTPIKTMQSAEVGRVIYANSITLTPGTFTASIEGDDLLIHSLDSDFINGLKGGDMDSRIKKIIK